MEGVTGFYVDGTLSTVTVKRTGTTARVACKVSMLLATYPGKSMFGFLKGGATVLSGIRVKDIAVAKEDCVVAVVEDLIKKKVIPNINQRVANQVTRD